MLILPKVIMTTNNLIFGSLESHLEGQTYSFSLSLLTQNHQPFQKLAFTFIHQLSLLLSNALLPKPSSSETRLLALILVREKKNEN